MNRFVLTAVVLFSSLFSDPLDAQGPMRVAPSGRAFTEVQLTMIDTAAARAAGAPSKIRIEYGQPHLRGRTLHTEGLVPYDQGWRLGANDATMLTTDVALVIGGQPVPKGSYVLLAMPARNGWKLFIQKPVGSTMAAAMSYKPEYDIARIDLRVSTLTTPLESFTMWLVPSTGADAAKGELRFAWGTALLSTDWIVK